MIKLTQTVQKGGCAAKVAAVELRDILSKVSFPPNLPQVKVDGKNFDDAALYEISPTQWLVQTLDFFTPIVDTPKLFGKISAANALSDVYAMGGSPKTALAILAFPLATLDKSIATEVLQGACEILTQAQCSLVGGHSIDDETLKFGLSVTGVVHPEKAWTNTGARKGDHLILTKPLGTGTATAALKRGEVSEADIADALHSMARLNNCVDLLSDVKVNAATDITGFGLLGHALHIARASQVTLKMNIEKIPRFASTMDFLQKGFLTKAHRSNKDYVLASTQFKAHNDLQSLLLFDPQTSGGLLLSIPQKDSERALEKLKLQFPQAARIGEVTAVGSFPLEVS